MQVLVLGAVAAATVFCQMAHRISMYSKICVVIYAVSHRVTVIALLSTST